MDPQLQTLIDLQGYDARIASLEAEAVRLPKQIESIQASLAEAKKQAETVKGGLLSTSDPDEGGEVGGAGGSILLP